MWKHHAMPPARRPRPVGRNVSGAVAAAPAAEAVRLFPLHPQPLCSYQHLHPAHFHQLLQSVHEGDYCWSSVHPRRRQVASVPPRQPPLPPSEPDAPPAGPEAPAYFVALLAAAGDRRRRQELRLRRRTNRRPSALQPAAFPFPPHPLPPPPPPPPGTSADPPAGWEPPPVSDLPKPRAPRAPPAPPLRPPRALQPN
ncbi:hypothetical protein Vafri_4335 [Volvox africanus]|uniref:Uncharacterized protein n=1 Tax=Volvox africanus TaxID=51714 RepID=A0A8J4EVQ4_9CHLO|nr:hypothetical protein Vafri_4335 [Volvox africanus]